MTTTNGNSIRVATRATSISWIPSEAVKGMMKGAFTTGMSHYDPPPPPRLDDLDAMRDADAFRFANVIEVWAEFDGGRLVDHGQSGGVVMGSTTVNVGGKGVTFAAVKMPDLRPEPVGGDGWVRFSQTSGGRTALPLPRAIAKPPYFRLQSPLVWTTLQITLHSDGRTETDLVGASPFPRHWVYDADDAIALKAGVADWSSWVGQPSWQKTPWGDQDSPVVVAEAETALERELSQLLMHGAHKPKIREIGEGALLAAQGDWSKELFLVLDGMLSVNVGEVREDDGAIVNERELGVIGPGAVVGERSILENRRRTATLRAMTPVRVAVAPADAVDHEALRALSETHRREEE